MDLDKIHAKARELRNEQIERHVALSVKDYHEMNGGKEPTEKELLFMRRQAECMVGSLGEYFDEVYRVTAKVYERAKEKRQAG